jgi:hypothetical protein
MPALTQIQIASGTDDAREIAGTVTTNSTSSGEIDATNEYIGLRFIVPTIASGTTITNATLTVAVTATTQDEFHHTIYGQAADNPGAFTSAGSNDISGRTPTTATVAWGDGTNLALAADQDVTSPDLTAIVQEIVNRPGWAAGNAMVFIIQGGSVATEDMTIHMFEGALGAAKAARLDISYATGGVSTIGAARYYRSQQ